MNESRVIDQILDMEVEFDLYNQKIDDVYFWERYRFHLYSKLLIKLGFVSESHHSLDLGPLNRIKIILSSFKNFIFKNPFMTRKTTDILFLGHQRRKLLEDGLWWDIYTDPIIQYYQEQTDSRTLSLEFYQKGSHLQPAKTKNLYYLDYLIFKANIRKIYFKRKFKLTNDEMALLKKIKDYILDKLGIEINIVEDVSNILILRKSYLPLFNKLVKKMKPSIVILVIGYANIREFFIDACKSNDIPTVELQHGIIHQNQLAYSYPGSNQKRCFADYLFTFGDFWKENIELPISENFVYSVGYPFFEKEINKYKKIKSEDQILIISQGPAGLELSRFAVELSQKIVNYKIIYKLHPSEVHNWEKIYPELFIASREGSIDIVSNEPALYHLFAQSKVQIGVSSLAIIEGLAFDLPTYLLEHPENRFLEYLIDKQIAELVNSVDDFIEKIDNMKDVETVFQQNYFFKKDSLKNTIKKIDELRK